VKHERRVADTVIEGVLIPVHWSVGGEIAQVGLMTFDESEYRVDAAAATAHELRRLLRKHVRIVGRIRGHRIVRVTTVEVLEPRPV
jgi:hypothetical protein